MVASYEWVAGNEASVEGEEESICFVFLELDDDVVGDSKTRSSGTEEGWLGWLLGGGRGGSDGIGWW